MKNPVPACIAWGCFDETDYSYLRFEVENKAYEFKHVTCQTLALRAQDLHLVVVISGGNVDRAVFERALAS